LIDDGAAVSGAAAGYRLGKGSETQRRWRRQLSAELITSTMPTLFIIPTVYTIFDDHGRFFRKE